MSNLLEGKEVKGIVLFSIPMIIGNVFQQLYNFVDSMIVGKLIGPNALAAVGSSFTLVVFLNSILIGLTMGAAVRYSINYGAKEHDSLKNNLFMFSVILSIFTIVLTILTITNVDTILRLTKVPLEIVDITRGYLLVIFMGIPLVSIYNYFASLLRSLGDSKTPLYFLIVSSILNVILDFVFVKNLDMGVNGAAWGTVVSQGVSALGILVYSILKVDYLKFDSESMKFRSKPLKSLLSLSALTSVQQSVMNLGLLMIQGLINSFGVSVMAAFAAASKIESFAYMPLQDYGNGFSTFISQNLGARKFDRIRKGIKESVKVIIAYCAVCSAIIILFKEKFLLLFLSPEQTEIIEIGSEYITVVAIFYVLIGFVFMFYGYFRGLGRPSVSIVLTLLNLGTRVSLAYFLALKTPLKLFGIWISIPIGWVIADVLGILLMKFGFKNLEDLEN